MSIATRKRIARTIAAKLAQAAARRAAAADANEHTEVRKPCHHAAPAGERTRRSADCRANTTAQDLEMLCAADHPAQPVDWLWHERIPVGKVTLLMGDPGLGKSLVALDVAARVTRGDTFPEAQRQGDKEMGRQGDSFAAPDPSLSPCLPVSVPGSPIERDAQPHAAEPGSVLIMSADDDLPETIRPRLDAAGADPSRVFVLPSIVDLRHDFDQLRAAVDRAPNCRLIIVDPVNAYVGPSDSHFHTVVRRVLAPLAQLAAEKRIAVLAIAHLRKNDGAAIQRAAGSIGFVANARAIWTICRDHADPEQFLFLPIKNNLGPTVCGLAYSIERHSELNAPIIAWRSGPIVVPAADALRSTPKPEPRLTEREEAREFIRQALAGGPRPAKRLIDEGQARGFHVRTLQRAFHDLDGHTAKRGWMEGWWWSLGEYPVNLDDNIDEEIFTPLVDTPYEQDVAYQAKMEKALSPLGAANSASPSASPSPSADLSPSAGPPDDSSPLAPVATPDPLPTSPTTSREPTPPSRFPSIQTGPTIPHFAAALD